MEMRDLAQVKCGGSLGQLLDRLQRRGAGQAMTGLDLGHARARARDEIKHGRGGRSRRVDDYVAHPRLGERGGRRLKGGHVGRAEDLPLDLVEKFMMPAKRAPSN